MMKRKTLIAVVVGITTVASAGAVYAISARSTQAAPPSIVSNMGSPIALTKVSAQDASALRSTGVTGNARLLAIRGDRAFYRFSGSAGGDCYALGTTSSPPSFGAIACPDEGFPNDQPVLDQSVFTFDPSTGEEHIVALEGFASDRVAQVGVLDSKGALHAATVTNNVYRLSKLPASPVEALVAYDASGTQVFSVDLNRK